MMTTGGRHFHCPYVGADVELTAERARHIATRHPEIALNLGSWLATTLSDPDTVRRSRRDARALLFARWYTRLNDGVHVVVVVNRDDPLPTRHWIVTAYAARRLPRGTIEWMRS